MLFVALHETVGSRGNAQRATHGSVGGLWGRLKDSWSARPLLAPGPSRALGADDETRTMRLWHVFAVACVAADLDARPAGDLSTASRKRLGGKTRAALGLGFGFAVVPRHAQELYSQFKPRTAEAWRKSMNQRRAIVPLQERAPSILAVAFTCSVLMVRTRSNPNASSQLQQQGRTSSRP